jgi:hypothetical protein
MCNLYLTYWEHQASCIKLRLIHNITFKAAILKEWTYFYRMMDDVCLLNAPHLMTWTSQPQQVGRQSAYTWIYPSCLTVATTAQLTTSCLTAPASFNYLDSALHSPTHKLYLHGIPP